MRKRPKDKLSESSESCMKPHRGRYFKWGRRLFLAGALFCAFQLVKVLYYSEPDLGTFSQETDTEPVYRPRTLKSANGSQSEDEGGAPWEKCDFEKSTVPYAFLVPYILLILILFVAIAIICDDFFVPSLEAISERLSLSEDVAGATFMAAGSSAPELFTSVAGVGAESDVGVGTIVGSAMFNILIIVALSAVLAGQVLTIDWRPLFRDASVYGLSIVLFIIFSWDGKIEWYEALILLVIYILYIVLMKFNSHLMTLLAKLQCRFCSHASKVGPEETHDEQNPTALEEASSKHDTEAGHTHSTLQQQVSSAHSMHRFVHSHGGELSGSFANRRRSHQHSGTHLPHHHHHHHDDHTVHHHGDHSITNPEDTQEEGKEDGEGSERKSASTLSSPNSLSGSETSSEVEENATMVLLPCLPAIRSVPPDLQLHLEEGKLGMVKYILRWFLFIISFPFVVVFTWTIPNCSENRKLYMVIGSFAMSIFWIAVISFAMVTLVARIGCILGIGHFTMGLIVVAIGTSVPDALSSVLVARDGFGDMAVSNAIGSNVFDINLGVGLPFLIRICADGGKPFWLMKKDDHDDYDLAPHPKFGFLLLLILVITIMMLAIFRFRLNSVTGLCFVIIYALFLAYAFVQETICDHGIKC